MSVDAKIKEQIQKLQVGELVILYELDTSIYGGGIYYFAPYTKGDSELIKFNNKDYYPIPAQITGYTLKSNGSLERPALYVANADRSFNTLIGQYNNLNGCILRIRTTFRQYLDDGTDPDITAQTEPQLFRLQQKTSHDKSTIQWELAPLIDNQKAMIPRNIVAAEKCIARYRSWDSDTSSFIYVQSSLCCPYTGTNYFDDTGAAVSAPADKCSKDLYGCRLRYPNTGDVLPYMQFPSIDRG